MKIKIIIIRKADVFEVAEKSAIKIEISGQFLRIYTNVSTYTDWAISDYMFAIKAVE